MDVQRQSSKDDSVWRRLWAAWKRFAKRVGDIQARILLIVFYFVVLAPFALVVRLTRDPLALRHGAGRGWRARVEGADPPAQRARSQF